MPNVIEFDAREFATVDKALRERPEQAERALVRTINKTLNWARTQGLRALARAHDIPIKALRSRRRGRVFRVSRVGLANGAVWFGTLPVRAAYVGTPRQTRLGARAGRHSFPGAFVARMPSGHIGIFKRADRSRLPIIEQVVELAQADTALDGLQRDLPGRLVTTFNQEFNYEVNVRGQG
jgi:hypothetical protein